MFYRKKYCCYRGIQNGDITAEEMKNKIMQGAILIDVRSRQEYQEGHLPGAINIPEYEVMRRIEKEVPKKNQLIVTYCQYGGRSRNEQETDYRNIAASLRENIYFKRTGKEIKSYCISG